MVKLAYHNSRALTSRRKDHELLEKNFRTILERFPCNYRMLLTWSFLGWKQTDRSTVHFPVILTWLLATLSDTLVSLYLPNNHDPTHYPSIINTPIIQQYSVIETTNLPGILVNLVFMSLFSACSDAIVSLDNSSWSSSSSYQTKQFVHHSS